MDSRRMRNITKLQADGKSSRKQPTEGAARAAPAVAVLFTKKQ